MCAGQCPGCRQTVTVEWRALSAGRGRCDKCDASLPGGSNVVVVRLSQITSAQRQTPDCLYTSLYYIFQNTPEHMSLKPTNTQKITMKVTNILCVCLPWRHTEE